MTGGLPVLRPSYRLPARQGFTLLSDLHLGGSQVDEGLIAAELIRAAEYGDRVLIGGDVFDAITPSDRRFQPSKVHPRFAGRDDLTNAVVGWAAEFLRPYAELIDVIGVGNHERTLVERAAVDPVAMLADALRDRGADALLAGYTAFVQYQADRGRRYTIWYTHGAGTGSTAADSLRKLQGRAASFQADLYWCGHYHARANAAEMLCEPGGWREVRHVVTGSYMHPYCDEPRAGARPPRDNYASIAGLRPHGMGGARVVLEWEGKRPVVRVTQ